MGIDNNGTIHIVWTETEENLSWHGSEILYSYNNGTGWTNPILISDFHNKLEYRYSYDPDIAITKDGEVYVVWYIEIEEYSYYDVEILCTYLDKEGWSKPFLISDDYRNWNKYISQEPSIDIDKNNTVHIVWRGRLALDLETYPPEPYINDIGYQILYVYGNKSNWSKIAIISDNLPISNNADCRYPDIAIGDNNINVVWYGSHPSLAGWDDDIFFTSSKGVLTELPPDIKINNLIPIGNLYFFIMIIGISCILILIKSVNKIRYS